MKEDIRKKPTIKKTPFKNNELKIINGGKNKKPSSKKVPVKKTPLKK